MNEESIEDLKRVVRWQIAEQEVAEEQARPVPPAVAAKKEWAPWHTLLGMLFFICVGLVMVMSVVFIVPGVALVAYGVVFAATEALEHAWNGLERFAAWFHNDDDSEASA